MVPQDATYLTLRDIDLSKYKQQARVGGIYKDFNQDQINQIQVSTPPPTAVCGSAWSTVSATCG